MKKAQTQNLSIINIKNNLFWIFLFFLISSCNNREAKKADLTTIDIESNINNMKQAKLSQFASGVRYVAIETRPDLFISTYPIFNKSGSLVLTYKIPEYSLCIFDISGRLISQFGIKGRGPEEYLYIGNLCFGEDDNIYFNSLYDLLEFNLDGTFKSKKSKLFLVDDKFYLRQWKFVNDSLIFGHVENSYGQAEYKAILINKSGEVIRYFKNYDLFKSTGNSRPIGGFSGIFTYNNKLYIKEQFSDTLFSLNSFNELESEYVFNLGNLKMPASLRLDFFKYAENANYYVQVGSVFQTRDYLLLDVNFGERFPARRLTVNDSISPEELRVNKLAPYTNTLGCLGIYDKKTGELFFCEPTSTDNPLFTTGLYNDIDAGPRFFPWGMLNDSTLSMLVPAKDLINHVASDDFKNNTPKFPEKKMQLEELASGLTKFDNPVVMIVTIKGK